MLWDFRSSKYYKKMFKAGTEAKWEKHLLEEETRTAIELACILSL